MKELIIDFLYLNLTICERCIATGDTLDEAITALAPVFETLGYDVTVNKINVATEELALKHRFVSSPTIRVNGIDICDEVVEDECESCGDLAGCCVDCRVFVYEGEQYTQPPTAAIVNGIMRVMNGQQQQREETAYEVPENLKKYYKGREAAMHQIYIYEPAMCCETGICGVGVDPELLRISTVINNLKSRGVDIQRYNLSNAPLAFIQNAAISQLINGDGVDSLPATMLDGKIVKTKTYPTNVEFSAWLGIPENILGSEASSFKVTPKKASDNGGGCCAPGSGCC